MRPTISLTDYKILRNLTLTISPSLKIEEVAQLNRELDRATIIEDGKLSDNIVRLNSLVEILEFESGVTTSVEIVLPEYADLKARKISVLAPVSIALLGFKKDDNIEWQMPGGLKRIQIISVTNKQHIIPIPSEE
ncbi:MAG: hypothetical protein EYC69_10595 [Bacteroidetes bacterium]|nr:MAG: hypothetical protein EYC69_10595 [Bacteroidota bacterium]